jgi:hypothetical protein
VTVEEQREHPVTVVTATDASVCKLEPLTGDGWPMAATTLRMLGG